MGTSHLFTGIMRALGRLRNMLAFIAGWFLVICIAMVLWLSAALIVLLLIALAVSETIQKWNTRRKERQRSHGGQAGRTA